MIALDRETLILLILKTEPGFLSQKELELNGYGSIKQLTPQDEVWVWDKSRVKDVTDKTELEYLILKVTDLC